MAAPDQRRQPSDHALDALAAIHGVASTLTGPGTLQQLASAALTRMRDALALDVAAMHIADDEQGNPLEPSPALLRRFAVSAVDHPVARAVPALAFSSEAWLLLQAARGPVVFGSAAGVVVANPFDPPAQSWFALPLQSQGGIVGTVVGAASNPIALDAVGVMTISALGNLLSAGIATARLRMEVERTAVQRERMRLAAELHDGLAQDLALAIRELALLEAQPSFDGLAGPGWGRLQEALQSAHRVVRAGLEDLSVVVPVGGISAAVEELCARFTERGLPVTVDVATEDEVSPDVLSVVLRIIQEALANVEKHAGATHAAVVVEARDGLLSLAVTDDGRGIVEALPEPGDGHFGIWIMRERSRSVGGSLELGAPRGGGTSVTVTAPLRRGEPVVP